MTTKKENITYKQAFNSAELFGYIKAIGTPVCLLIISMFVITQFGLFGINLLAPLTGVMWIAGAFVAWALPSQRESTCKETHIAIAVYVSGIFAIRLILTLAMGTSNEQMMASYSVVMPTTSALSIEGLLQTMMLVAVFLGPLSFLGMMTKKFVTFKKRMSKQKVMDNLRGLRDTGHVHSDYDR